MGAIFRTAAEEVSTEAPSVLEAVPNKLKRKWEIRHGQSMFVIVVGLKNLSTSQGVYCLAHPMPDWESSLICA